MHHAPSRPLPTPTFHASPRAPRPPGPFRFIPQPLVLILCLSSCIFLLPSAVLAATLFVDGRIEASGDGTTWTQALKTINEALGQAAAGDDIWVARGTYYTSITMKSGVGLYGGFAGNETAMEERVLGAHPTLIDGRAARSGRPAYHVVVMDAITSSTLDGCVITGGNANGRVPFRNGHGGGVYAPVSPESNVIRHCVIAGNSAREGGGIYGSARIDSCIISGNSATLGGGLTRTYATISNSIISGNLIVAGDADFAVGGGIFLYLSCPRVINCTVTGNSDAGVYYKSTGSNLTFVNTIFADNAGCGLWDGFAGTDPVIRNCLFHNNTPADYRSRNGLLVSGGPALNAHLETASDNVSGDPYFLMGSSLAQGAGFATGTWTAPPAFDRQSNRTLLSDAAARFGPNQLLGCMIRVSHEHGFEALVTSNTETVLSVSGDLTSYTEMGGTYTIVDYRLGYGSVAVDVGTGATAPRSDMDGQPRPVDIPDHGADGTGQECDIGAYELQLADIPRAGMPAADWVLYE